jgi:hypothetical protein
MVNDNPDGLQDVGEAPGSWSANCPRSRSFPCVDGAGTPGISGRRVISYIQGPRLVQCMRDGLFQCQRLSLGQCSVKCLGTERSAVVVQRGILAGTIHRRQWGADR